MQERAGRLSWSTLLKWALLALLVGGGVWVFTSSKPNHDLKMQVALRSAGPEQVELALYSIDYRGEQRLHQPAENNILDLSEPRERRFYSAPVELPGHAPKAMVSVVSDSQYEFRLGARVRKPTGAWGSTRFPRHEPITREEWESADWELLAPLSVQVIVHQPLLDGVRLLYYILFAGAALTALTLFVWRRWLS